MSWLKRLIAEPLVHFVAASALIFLAYAMLTGDRVDDARDTIVVSAGRVAQIVEIFTRTWQRPPTEDELKGLIDSFVREEVFYREGRKLGLDQDDTIVRRRLRQKMEFMIEPDEAALRPGPGALEAFLAANREVYRIPEMIAFRQMFFDPAIHGDAVEARAESALAALASTAGDAATDQGDPAILPSAMPLSSPRQIASAFGDEFAEGLAAAPSGRWSGPVASTFGLHLVHVDARQGPRDPGLDEVEGVVLRDWQSRKRRDIAEARYADLLAKYAVVVDPLPGLRLPAKRSRANEDARKRRLLRTHPSSTAAAADLVSPTSRV
jgi:hypothetical protein